MAPEEESAETNRYKMILEAIFLARHKPGVAEVHFAREDIPKTAKELKLPRPKNLGDLIYSFRFRIPLPQVILRTAPSGYEWSLKLAGRAKYKFALVREGAKEILPRDNLVETKIPDATPGVIARWAKGDEQALLAHLRYNRLIDIFTGVASYSLQNHFKTTVKGLGQVETDEVYVGVGAQGAQYVFPVQAKGGNDRLGLVQIEQDLKLCRQHFPELICRPIGAQFKGKGVIVLFEFQESTNDGEIRLLRESHYKLVPPSEISAAELEQYRRLSLSK